MTIGTVSTYLPAVSLIEWQEGQLLCKPKNLSDLAFREVVRLHLQNRLPNICNYQLLPQSEVNARLVPMYCNYLNYLQLHCVRLSWPAHDNIRSNQTTDIITFTQTYKCTCMYLYVIACIPTSVQYNGPIHTCTCPCMWFEFKVIPPQAVESSQTLVQFSPLHLCGHDL